VGRSRPSRRQPPTPIRQPLNGGFPVGLFHRDVPMLVKARVWAVGIASPRVSFLQTRAVASAIDNDFLAEASTSYRATTGKPLPAFMTPSLDATPGPQDAPGDFLKTLLEWLMSPEGREFITWIFSLFGFVI